MSGTELLKYLNAASGSQVEHDVLDSVQDLQEMFEHRMARCAAAERGFADQKGFLEIVERAQHLNNKQVWIDGSYIYIYITMTDIIHMAFFSTLLEEMQLLSDSKWRQPQMYRSVTDPVSFV